MRMEKKAEFLYLTTTGWKSGQPHEIEIWYVSHQGCCYVCAEGRDDAHWVRNIRRQPRITFWVEGRGHAGIGRPLDSAADSELIAAVSALMDAKYGWSDGLIVELRPDLV